MGFGKGVIPVQYDETAVGNLRDHGIYTILMKVEFFPAQSTNTTPAPPPAPKPTTSPNNTTYKTTTTVPTTTGTMNNTTTTTAIPGVWKGTFGSGANNGPNYYSFQLNADGTMQVLDGSGKSIATGTYTFSNNQLSGFYRYNGASNGFSFAATLTGTQLNGTWGPGTTASGGGRWVMNKAGVTAATNIR